MRLSNFLAQAYRELGKDVEEWAEANVQSMIGSMFGGMDPSQLSSAMFQQHNSDDDPYAVLDLSPTCSDDDVRTRYRELMKILHPDITQGKTTRFARQVNAAYEAICKTRGIGKSQ